jgi:hypothetical protein
MFENRQDVVSYIKQTRESFNISLLEAITHVCEKFNIEPEVMASWIRQSHKLRDELREEVGKLRLLK